MTWRIVSTGGANHRGNPNVTNMQPEAKEILNRNEILVLVRYSALEKPFAARRGTLANNRSQIGLRQKIIKGFRSRTTMREAEEEAKADQERLPRLKQGDRLIENDLKGEAGVAGKQQVSPAYRLQTTPRVSFRSHRTLWTLLRRLALTALGKTKADRPCGRSRPFHVVRALRSPLRPSPRRSF